MIAFGVLCPGVGTVLIIYVLGRFLSFSAIFFNVWLTVLFSTHSLLAFFFCLLHFLHFLSPCLFQAGCDRLQRFLNLELIVRSTLVVDVVLNSGSGLEVQ